MQVHRIPNPGFTSNSYLVYNISSDVIVIDPGNPSPEILINSLKQKGKRLRAVFLTHEHYDHIAGVDPLSEYFDFDLYCSRTCETGIRDPKTNMSEYLDDINSLIINKKVIEIRDNETMIIEGLNCTFFHTPGHSPGGVCIKIENAFFTGDTLLNKTKTPLNLRGGSKEQYQQSIEKIKKLVKPGDIIYPGHGVEFVFDPDWSFKL